MQHWVVGREGEVVRILVVSSKVELLFPVHHAAPGASSELFQVFLVHLGGLWVQGSSSINLVEHASGVKENLPNVIDIPFPLVEALCKEKIS